MTVTDMLPTKRQKSSYRYLKQILIFLSDVYGTGSTSITRSVAASEFGNVTETCGKSESK
jgi:hypothetical protein